MKGLIRQKFIPTNIGPHRWRIMYCSDLKAVRDNPVFDVYGKYDATDCKGLCSWNTRQRDICIFIKEGATPPVWAHEAYHAAKALFVHCYGSEDADELIAYAIEFLMEKCNEICR